MDKNERPSIHLQMRNGRWWVMYPDGSGEADVADVRAAKTWAYARNSQLAKNEYSSVISRIINQPPFEIKMAHSTRLVHEPRKQTGLK